MLIKNCMLIDGADIFEEMKDIRIVNGKIKEVADCLMPEGDEEIIDAAKMPDTTTPHMNGGRIIWDSTMNTFSA